MVILYVRCSTEKQTIERQKPKNLSYDLIVEDKCSGIIPFFDRKGGRIIKKHLLKSEITQLLVWDVDRLGRNLLDNMYVIKIFSDKLININFLHPGFNTIVNCSLNLTDIIAITMHSYQAHTARLQIKDNQKQGIALAKSKGLFGGRKKGSIENTKDFLNKPKNAQVVKLLSKGISCSDAAIKAGVHPNTVTKIKRLYESNSSS